MVKNNDDGWSTLSIVQKSGELPSDSIYRFHEIQYISKFCKLGRVIDFSKASVKYEGVSVPPSTNRSTRSNSPLSKSFQIRFEAEEQNCNKSRNSATTKSFYLLRFWQVTDWRSIHRLENLQTYLFHTWLYNYNAGVETACSFLTAGASSAFHKLCWKLQKVVLFSLDKGFFYVYHL